MDAYALRHSGGDDRPVAPRRPSALCRGTPTIGVGRPPSAGAPDLRLAPLERRGPTIADVPMEGGPDVHLEGVHAYIQAVRGEWSAHHATARRLLAGLHA